MPRDLSLIALDWGTSSLRAWRFDGSSTPGEKREFPWGIMKLPNAGVDRDTAFRETLNKVCADWLTASPPCPVIACGMVGSAQGWREAPYAPCPVSLPQLASQLLQIDLGKQRMLNIIPGVVKNGNMPEVMRGEETQIFGALAANKVLQQANEAGEPILIGLPGTHSKWAIVHRNMLSHFHTFMTGELFDALIHHTILGASMVPAEEPQWPAFLEGLEVARSRHSAGLLSTIFSTRTRFLTGQLPQTQQADYLSGLIIGHEMCGLGKLLLDAARPDMPIALIGNDALCDRYQRAFNHYFSARPLHLIKYATENGLWQIAKVAGLFTTDTGKIFHAI
ncbi:2-dehydro-3-deoxygalactonokinase [Buttiauxella warmboldiae]|uniref:2-dehydro-3-deoxygalactonokinase n=1 Tax=Buttiauxella warmboldiae TaxID=82993 RepID=A0A3N5E8L8_9ENTR|nr:2-dehydro-3-deoxygalactonokinase [Buttiauxella warmboldiae]RPH26492.1 2-dehydro-3-deoxygalactonokinase [Buttiauxella warmboldiae]